MHVELRHLEAFLAVARRGHFTRAAADLHVSQPALTVQIRQFETALGLRLFDRNNRRVALTQPGRDLVAPIERIVLDLRAIVEGAHDQAAGRRGVVTVACLPSMAAARLPRALGRLAQRRDGIVVRVRDGVAARVAELVKSGEVDFGLTSCGSADPGLVERPLFVDRLAAFVRPDHRLAGRRAASLREVAAHPLILTSADSSVRQLVDRVIERTRLTVRVVQEVTYMTTAIGMAAAGLGVAILPESAVAAEPDGIRRVAIRTPVITRHIGIVTLAGRSLSPAAQTLVDILARP